MSNKTATSLLYENIFRDLGDADALIERGIEDATLEKKSIERAILSIKKITQMIDNSSKFFNIEHLILEDYEKILGVVGNPQQILLRFNEYVVTLEQFNTRKKELIVIDDHQALIEYIKSIVNKETDFITFLDEKFKELNAEIHKLCENIIKDRQNLGKVLKRIIQEMPTDEDCTKIEDSLRALDGQLEELKLVSIDKDSLIDLVENEMILSLIVNTLTTLKSSISETRRDVANLLGELGDFYISLVEAFSEKGNVSVEDILSLPELREKIEGKEPIKLLREISEKGLLQEKFEF